MFGEEREEQREGGRGEGNWQGSSLWEAGVSLGRNNLVPLKDLFRKRTIYFPR